MQDRRKVSRDGPIFILRDPVAPLRFRAHDEPDALAHLSAEERTVLAREHERLLLLPIANDHCSEIERYARHIPYNSERREFPGRIRFNSFEVLQYSFQYPRERKELPWTVLWDYQTGMVRITPFFKALGYSKTQPAKAINANPGLKELSTSVTGGALVAQGYWMPFYCARAICATFCYDIRYALTPLFGVDFVNQCIRRGEPGFDSYVVAPEIIVEARRGLEAMHAPGRDVNLRPSTPRRFSVQDNLPTTGDHHHHHRHGQAPFRSFEAGESSAMAQNRHEPTTPARQYPGYGLAGPSNLRQTPIYPIRHVGEPSRAYSYSTTSHHESILHSNPSSVSPTDRRFSAAGRVPPFASHHAQQVDRRQGDDDGRDSDDASDEGEGEESDSEEDFRRARRPRAYTVDDAHAATSLMNLSQPPHPIHSARPTSHQHGQNQYDQHRHQQNQHRLQTHQIALARRTPVNFSPDVDRAQTSRTPVQSHGMRPPVHETLHVRPTLPSLRQVLAETQDLPLYQPPPPPRPPSTTTTMTEGSRRRR